MPVSDRVNTAAHVWAVVTICRGDTWDWKGILHGVGQRCEIKHIEKMPKSSNVSCHEHGDTDGGAIIIRSGVGGVPASTGVTVFDFDIVEIDQPRERKHVSLKVNVVDC
jgi:hypothetical protein